MLSAWDQMPADLRALGYTRDAAYLFGRLQRVATWDAAGPVLNRRGRELVEAKGLSLELPRIVEERPSSDGSTRVVLALADGARIEAVHMPRAVRRPRVTVCLSSQVGCAMGCTFCATARMGLVRSLTPAEMVAQLLAVMHRFGPRSVEQLNVVFMGMGEPLANYARVVAAVSRIIAAPPDGFGISARSVTVSTVGLAPAIRKLADERLGVTLALSLHTPDDELRDTLVPVNNRWKVDEVLDAARYYGQLTGRRVSIEYALIRDVNDQPWRADLLGKKLHAALGPLAHVNLIPLNPTPGSKWDASPKPVEREFVRRVRAQGVSCTVRDTRGREIAAACGQLAATEK